MTATRRIGAFLVAFAFVAVSVAICEADAPPLHLVWNAEDANGFPLNPFWSYQKSSKDLRDAAAACDRFPTGVNSVASCSDDVVSYDVAEYRHLLPEPAELGCNLYDNQGLAPNSLHGHINWRTVTMVGSVTFHDYNFSLWDGFHGVFPGDGDYDFFLSTPDWLAYVKGNDMSDNSGITVEFSDRETLQRAEYGWWFDFRQSVFGNGPHFERSAGLLQPSQQDVVVGLLGIDTKHVAHTELHPAYALAVQVPDNEGMAWAIFARDWGNEGGCSARAHPLNLPGGRLTLDLPTPESAAFEIDTRKSVMYGINTVAPWGARLRRGHLTVTIELPAPSRSPFAYGEIHVCVARCRSEARYERGLPFDASIVPDSNAQ